MNFECTSALQFLLYKCVNFWPFLSFPLRYFVAKMDSGEEAICEEYESSLEDLTFNSKPLINVLTMLAEENSQYASSITKLIAKRTRQVCVQVNVLS